MPQKKTIARKRPLVLVLDIETEQFTDKFRNAGTTAARTRHAPKIRLCGVYNVLTRKCKFYLSAQCDDLIRMLLKADVIVTFNGDNFDFLVLLRHGGLSQVEWQRIQKKHTDLYQTIRMETGRSYKLDQLAHLNLGERKKVDGREMSRLDLAELKKANRSDLSQTYRLWQMWQRDHLIYPYRSWPARDSFDATGGPHSQLPPGDYIDLDIEEMTEGQMAEYLAGTWGITARGEFVEMC